MGPTRRHSGRETPSAPGQPAESIWRAAPIRTRRNRIEGCRVSCLSDSSCRISALAAGSSAGSQVSEGNEAERVEGEDGSKKAIDREDVRCRVGLVQSKRQLL